MTVSPLGAARWFWEPIDYNDRANRKNRLSSGLSLARRLLVQRAYGYPKEICPEVSSHCWMRCKYCWLGACHISDHRDHKFMELDTFKALIDDVAVFGPRVTMAGCGEPLANNKVYDMIRYAADHGLMVSLFTNALNLNDTNTQRIFESGLYRINLSLDSTDPGEFEQMRGTRDDHARVLRNTRLFIRAKKQRHRKYPLVQLQTIRVRPNQGAIAQFVQDARAMGADLVKVKSLALYPQADQRFHRWILY